MIPEAGLWYVDAAGDRWPTIVLVMDANCLYCGNPIQGTHKCHEMAAVMVTVLTEVAEKLNDRLKRAKERAK
jgi:hypothetical protein